ncbi:flagellar hook-length control protein FliK [Geodermatophilus sp. SYSU D01176]
MTAPLAPAAPAPAPTAASPAATDAPDGRERFASALDTALDDAVSSGQGGPRGRGRAATTGDTPAEPAPDAPDGEQPVVEPPVAGAGMPPGLWALFTGIGPAATGPANAVAHAAAGSAVVAVDAAAGAALGTAALPVVPDGVPAAVPPAGLPAAGLPAGAVPVPAAPAADAVLPGAPVPAPATAAAPDPLPGLTVVLAGADAPGTPTAPELGAPDSVVPLPQPAAAPATAGGADTGTGTGSGQDGPAPAPAPAPSGAPLTAAGAPALPTAAPVPVADPAAPAAPAPPVSGQVAQQVAVLRTAPDGTHTLTVVLTPEALGPVEVQVTLSQGAVDLSLKSATEAGRAALLEALPDLRRDLASAGLTCTNASVDRDAGGAWASAQQHAAGHRAGRHGQSDGRGRPWPRGSDGDADRPVRVSTTPGQSGLDVRV